MYLYYYYNKLTKLSIFANHFRGSKYLGAFFTVYLAVALALSRIVKMDDFHS